MAIFSFINRSSGSAYFVLETVPNSQGFFDSGSLRGAWGAYYNFTGSSPFAKVSSDYVFGYVAPPGSSSFEYNPTEYIQTGSVYFRGTGELTVTVTGEVTSSRYDFGGVNPKIILNTVPIENVFEATWDTTRTTAGSTTSTQIALPLVAAATGSLYNFVINWGDNTSSSISSSLQSEVTHTYASSGTYITKMWGTMRGWRFNGTGDRNKLQSVNKWGGLQIVSGPFLTSIEDGGACNAFTGCNSASFADVIGVPDLRYTDSLRSVFGNCLNLTTINNLDKWDIGRIKSLRTMFFNAIKFNQDVGAWDVSNVLSFVGTFGASVVTQPEGNNGMFNNGESPSIGNWDTKRAINMLQMFVNQGRFNQNIGNWNISRVTNISAMFGMYTTTTTPWQTLSGSFNNGGSPSIGNWDVSRVTLMTDTFGGQLAFNQDLSNWDVSKVTDFSRMFSISNPTPTFTSSLFVFNNNGSSGINNWNTTSSTGMREMFRYAGNFNQPIGDWRVSSVSNFTNFMETKTFNDYSVANYDALLNGWASRPVVSARSINFGTIKYSAAASASRAILTSAPNSWTIVDGGQV